MGAGEDEKYPLNLEGREITSGISNLFSVEK